MSADIPSPTSNSSRVPTIALVGNPNTGKTTLFNALTGLRQATASYPGVTVEKKVGQFTLPDGRAADLLDLPGTYSLAAVSPDELVVADVLLGQQRGQPLPDAVILVTDATCLERNLYFVTQVLEASRPAVIALTMFDLAQRSGIQIDLAALSSRLGCPVVPVMAARGEGLDELRAELVRLLANQSPGFRRGILCEMPAPVERAISQLHEFLEARAGRLARPVHRVELIRVLLDEHGAAETRLVSLLGEDLAARLRTLRAQLAAADIELATVEPRTRYAAIEAMLSGCVRPPLDDHASHALTDRVDRVLIHPLWGTLTFAAVMAILFQCLYAVSDPAMNLIDSGFVALKSLVQGHVPEGAMQSLLCDGLISGVGAVLMFLPQIVLLFVFIALLEDCGYLARAAMVMDRVLSRIGLSGRSFVPMLSSFACAVPGIMAARSIADRRDRIATIMVAPLMSCSARLPVYVLLIGAFIPKYTVLGGLVGVRGLTLLALYALGPAIAVPTAWMLKRTLLRGRPAPLLLEVPTFKWPSPRITLIRTFDRAKEFVVRAGTIILVVTLIMWALGYYPHSPAVAAEYDARLAHARATLSGDELEARTHRLLDERNGAFVRESFVGRAGRAIEPVVRPLGWNWQTGAAVLASFPAREMVISALGTLYNIGSGADEESVQLQRVLHDHREPDGRRSFTPLVGLSLMVFVALCCQCVATLAVIRQETRSWRWPVLAFTYQTGLAYFGAMAVYQFGSAMGWA